MSQIAIDSTPLGSKTCLNSSKSLFHDFVRPRGQHTIKHASSPFKGSPQNDNFDFIPLGYSSPINNRGRGSGGNWRGNRKNFSSPSNNSSYNSMSPYNMNKKHFRNSPSSSNNSSFSPYNDMERSRGNSSYKKRRDNNFSFKTRNSDDISLYYHSSMLEDPWADLEQKLRNRTTEQNCSLGSKDALEKSVSNLSSVDSLLSSDSDEGADSQETDSTVSVSDGSS